MASSMFYGDYLSKERARRLVSARVTIGATGAPTLDVPNSKGVLSIARNSAGQYLVILMDRYVKLSAFWIGFQKDTVPTAPNAAPMVTGTDVTGVSTAGVPQVTFSCYNNAGVATDPASGEVMVLEFELQDGS